MTTLAAARVPVVRAASGPTLPLVPVRAGVLLALAIFGGMHWMAMLDPAEPGRAWQAAGLALLVVLALRGAARLPGLLRPLAAALTAVAALGLALLAGGAADELLRPDRWGTLAAGLGRGIDALPAVNVPYRGDDAWTILALGAGGTALAVAAALVAFWPRRGGRTGFPMLALVLLVALYAVPAIVLNLDAEFLRGAVLALLVLAFLRLERLPVGDAPAAGIAATAAAVVALAAAPLLDGREPWWDYESWAVDTAAARTVGFTWDHDYSPLDWPRDGRELMRVKARQPAYWKAMNLDTFDGDSWRQDGRARMESPYTQLPDDLEVLQAGRQEISVTLRNLQSDTFVTAGVATEIREQVNFPLGGGIFASPDGLRQGDTYVAEVYTPRPTERELREARTAYEDWLRGYRTIAIPSVPDTERPALIVSFPGFDEAGEPEAERFGDIDFERVVDQLDLERTWALAQELKAGAETPYEYVEAVEAYLERGFSYSEAPPAEAATLEGFLFDAKVGFCQQYSGAAALLLRMGGLPARVATGFATGSYDSDEKEYVVRDLDAHSWVEVWFPGYGWVTRDPTPAAAPPRSQAGENRSGASVDGALPGAPSLGGERLSQLDEGREAAGGGRDWTAEIIGGAVLLVLAGAGALYERRRRRRLPPPAQRPMAEFERALRRARFDGGPGLTLSGMERRYAGWPGAAGYVRALREQRYTGHGDPPTPAQRRGLRAALARDAGVLRSWWALPPRLR